MSFASMLQGLTSAGVRFSVIGGVAAAAHGSERVTNDLDVCYDTSEENISRLAHLLYSWNAYPRGIELGMPFFMDARQFRIQPGMTLTTREGEIDVLAHVDGLGGYANVMARSIEVEGFDVRFPVLDLPGLITAKRAANRDKDVAQLPELEALLALRDQEER
jgi:hypothetical protein